MTPERTHWLDQPRSARVLWRVFVVVLAMTLCAEWLVPLHPTFAVEHVFGFSAIFGFSACAAMILVAKALGWLIKRQETYYAEKDAIDE